MTRRCSGASATPRPKSGANGTAAAEGPGVDARRRERAYQTLRNGIVSGVYGPNQHLPEMDLAAELGVSRQTVGIALVRLEQEGLVATQSAIHVTGAHLSADDHSPDNACARPVAVAEQVGTPTLRRPPAHSPKRSADW